MTIKDRIKALCRERGVTAQKLEQDCGFANGYISKLDKSTPNGSKLKVIAEYFGVSVDYIVGNDSEKVTDSNAMRIAALSRLLTTDNQRKVMEMIEYLIYQQEKEKDMSSGTA